MNAAFAQQPTLWQNSGTTKIKPSPSKIITTDKQIESTLAIGTSPLAVTSTTKVSNLNADLLDDQSGSYYLDLNNMLAGTLAVERGGTGQTSYTDGQLLIGNTTGNTLTKSTLTGTANQVVVTNGSGSITLSTPQSIATSSTPQFAKLGIGVSPTRFLDIIGTTEQARIAYDSSNYMSMTVSSAGVATIGLTASSGTPRFVFNNPWQSSYGAFNTTPATNIGLRVATGFTGSTTTRGILVDGLTDSGATTAHYCFTGQVRTTDSVFTLPTAASFQAASSSKGASATITNLIGFDCADQSDGASNFGFRSQVSSGSGKWGFYASGSANNAFSGSTRFGGVTAPTSTVDVTGSIAATTSILSSGASGGVGYTTGAGGTVTQLTSRTTGVTINKASGAITLVSAAGSTSWQKFTVTNSAVAATDVIVVNQKSGTDSYMTHVTRVAAGAFDVIFATTGGTTTEQPVFNFAVVKGASS